MIDKLTQVIIGWTHYHRTVVASQAFGRCDTLLFSMLRRWAFRRHPTKPKGWVVSKYWTVNQGEGWKFKAQDGPVLKYHRDTPIRRHTKVQGTASPYDGNLIRLRAPTAGPSPDEYADRLSLTASRCDTVPAVDCISMMET